MLDPIEQWVVDDLARCGLHMIRVDADALGPGFVYSVGMMHTLNHPEVIVFGLDGKTLEAIVRTVHHEICNGRLFTTPGVYDGLLEGFACKFVPVLEEHHVPYLGFAMWHRRYVGKIGTLQAVQCLWPDKRGVFPDEPDCNTRVIELQPLLNRP